MAGDNIEALAVENALREGAISLERIANGAEACALGALSYVTVHGEPKLIAALGQLLSAAHALKKAPK